MGETDAVRKIVPAAVLLLGGKYSDCVLRFADEERPAHLDLLREWCGAFEEGLAPERNAPEGEAVESRPSKKRRAEAGEDSDETDVALPIFTVVRERPALIEAEDWPGLVDDFMRWLYGAPASEEEDDDDDSEDKPKRKPVDAAQDTRSRLVLYHLARRLRVSEAKAKELARSPYLVGCFLTADEWTRVHFGPGGCKDRTSLGKCEDCRWRDVVVSCNFNWTKTTQFRFRRGGSVDIAPFLCGSLEACFKIRLEHSQARLRLDPVAGCLVVDLPCGSAVRVPFLGETGYGGPDVMVPICSGLSFGPRRGKD